MSSTEDGWCGLWSCLYCEGVWLSRADALALAALKQVDVSALALPMNPVEVATDGLSCPACESVAFDAYPVQDQKALLCRGCHGVFLPRASARKLAPVLAGGSFFVARTPSGALDWPTVVAADAGATVVLALLMALLG